MATTNLVPFNPTQTNQETDAAYLADSNRTGGFGTDAIWPSPLANKTLNLLSNYLYALFSAFATKGFTTNDDNVPLLTAVCANFLTTADVLPGLVGVTFSPTAAFNAGTSNGFQMRLTGNITSSTISGATSGQLLAFYFTQDAVGGRTVVFPTSFVGAVQPDPTALAVSLQMFRVDLSGAARAVTPVMSSSNSGTAIFNALTLASGATTGQVLTFNGTSFVPQNTSRAQGSVAIYSSGGRAANTVYQNTSGGVLFISGAMATVGSSVGAIAVVIGATSSPTTGVWQNEATATQSGGSAGFYAAVPNGWYYEVVTVGAVTPTVQVWAETVIS